MEMIWTKSCVLEKWIYISSRCCCIFLRWRIPYALQRKFCILGKFAYIIIGNDDNHYYCRAILSKKMCRLHSSQRKWNLICFAAEFSWSMQQQKKWDTCYSQNQNYNYFLYSEGYFFFGSISVCTASFNIANSTKKNKRKSMSTSIDHGGQKHSASRNYQK